MNSTHSLPIDRAVLRPARPTPPFPHCHSPGPSKASRSSPAHLGPIQPGAAPSVPFRSARPRSVHLGSRRLISCSSVPIDELSSRPWGTCSETPPKAVPTDADPRGSHQGSEALLSVSTGLIHRSVHSHTEVPKGSDVDHRDVIHSGLWIEMGPMFHVKLDFPHPGLPHPGIAGKLHGTDIRLVLCAQ
jgi:hypothetical protein